MESSRPETPPFLAAPLAISPFTGLTISPSRVGRHAGARATARPYREVAARLRRWQTQGRVHRDDAPAVYLHEYTSGGLTVRGLVGLIDLARRAATPQARAVFPHEGVYAAQSVQLAARMVQMRLNPAPILLVHHGPADLRALVQATATRPADREFDDGEGQHHRVWAIREPTDLSRIREGVAVSRPLIADGHHRYSAYLQLQHEHPGTGWDQGLAMLVDQDDTPLFLGAIHRILHGVSLGQLGDALAGTAHVLELRSQRHALEALGPQTLVLTDGRTWATLRLQLAPHQLAVEALHQGLLPRLTKPPTRIEYHHAVEDTLHHVRRGRETAVLLPAPGFDQVHHVVTHDRLLPQKATSFQPKPAIGVLMRSLDG